MKRRGEIGTEQGVYVMHGNVCVRLRGTEVASSGSNQLRSIETRCRQAAAV
jgi:hypothetical protein